MGVSLGSGRTTIGEVDRYQFIRQGLKDMVREAIIECEQLIVDAPDNGAALQAVIEYIHLMHGEGVDE